MNATSHKLIHPQCTVYLDLPSYYCPMIGMGIFLAFLISFGIAYALKEHERTKNYYGRVDAASRRSESARDNLLQQGYAPKEVQQMLQDQGGTAMEISAINPSDREAEDAAVEDELYGRNPNKMSVVREASPTHHSAGIKVMMKKRKSVAQRSVVCGSMPRSATVSALSIFAPRILFDSTSRGLEILDIVTKSVPLAQANEEKLREKIVDAVKDKLDVIRERRHIIFAIPERGGEPIVKGTEAIVGMMRQNLVLSVGFEMPAMRIYCYELDVGESAVSILAPAMSASGSGNRSNTAVDRVTKRDQERDGGGPKGEAAVATVPDAAVPAATAAKSPAPKAQVGHPMNQSGSGKSEKKKLNGRMMEARTQMTQMTVPARSPVMPSSTCPSTCPTKKSTATPAPTPKKSSIVKKATGNRKNSNISRVRTARTPGAHTPQRTQQTVTTAIEESLYSVQPAKSKKNSSKTKSVMKSETKLFPV